MNILLTGASGFIGRNLSQALMQAGHTVTPVSRHHGIDAQKLHAHDWQILLENVQIVINAMGIIAPTWGQSFDTLHSQAPCALFEACERSTAVERVIQISALGCTEQAFSAFHRSKWIADERLRTSTTEWFVLRPSLVYGASGVSAQWFMRMARSPVFPQIGDGQQWVQPIHISDLVATALHCIQSPQTRKTLDMASERIWTWGDWVADMRAALQKPPALRLSMPLVLAKMACSVGQHLHPLMHPDNLRMLLTNSTCDPLDWIEFLGRRPIPHHHQLFFCDAHPYTGAMQ